MTQYSNTPTSFEELDESMIGDMIMAMMGVDQMAYIKTTQDAGRAEYTVFAADGTPLASFGSQEEAFFSIKKHNLMPVNLH